MGDVSLSLADGKYRNAGSVDDFFCKITDRITEEGYCMVFSDDN